MAGSGKKYSLTEDNRGASMLLILAVFVVMLTVVMNLLMLVSAGDETTGREYEAEQTGLVLASVYDVLNRHIIAGTWEDAFAEGEITTVNVEGFEDGDGNGVPVRIEIGLERTLATVNYYITYSGREYCISAKYSCHKKDDEVKIELRYCEGIS